ncbi:glycosyltransferase family 39 protein, partial [Polynucleobacter sp.]|uniref:glycosyltransferase family 39 protein n=1 Tax=Polynucleobacter sp. TaxID=2029855 RepID=UPI003341492C
QRSIGLTSLAYLANLFNIRFLLGNAQPLADPASVFLTQRDRDYGVAFELPAEFLIKVLNLHDANAYFFRHLLTFLICYVAVYFFYKLVKLRYQDWRIGLLGAAFLVLTPRIFGDGFFNDKDLVFMSAFAIGIYTLVRFVLKPGLLTGLWHALACALAIDLRLMAVILPAVTVVALLVLAARKELSFSKLIGYLGVYLAVMALLVVAFWPWLWLDPLGNFVLAFKNMARFRHAPDMVFMGDIVNASRLPWYYIPVWIGVTTPILYLILFMVGASTTVNTLIRNIWGKTKTLWTNDAQLQDLLFLGLFCAPLLAVIMLHSILYNGWRQMYFIYPAFLLVSIRGLISLWALSNTKQLARRILIALVIGSMGFTSYWMVRWHPYQYLYFNVLAGPFAKRFDVDYWAVAYRPVLAKIVGQDPKASYSI